MKRFRYRLYPDPSQEEFLARSFGCARVVFNDALALRQAAFADGEPVPSCGDLMKRMAVSKKTAERAWLAEVSDVALQQSLRDLDQAYRNFFSSVKGKRAGRKVSAPRFKSRKDNTATIRFTRAYFRVRRIGRATALLSLPKMAPVKMMLSRPLPASPSSVTVIREADGRYYASFVVDAPVRVTPAAVHPVVGIDLGLNALAVLARTDGTKVKVRNPRHLRKQLRKLARAQKELARREKGSANRTKSRLKVAAIHRKVRETRSDHHHKLARKIVDENQVIGLETLGITGLGRTRLAKSIHDAGWGLLVRLIEEKAAEAGRTVVRAAREFPSTRLCSSCGTIGEKKPLHVRSWTCLCGVTHDRDINAAINIRNVAAGHAETLNACGGKVRPRPVAAHPRETRTTRALRPPKRAQSSGVPLLQEWEDVK